MMSAYADLLQDKDKLGSTRPESDHGPGVRDAEVVGLDGLEPSTSVLSGPRSNRLSYRPARGAPSPAGKRPGGRQTGAV